MGDGGVGGECGVDGGGVCNPGLSDAFVVCDGPATDGGLVAVEVSLGRKALVVPRCGWEARACREFSNRMVAMNEAIRVHEGKGENDLLGLGGKDVGVDLVPVLHACLSYINVVGGKQVSVGALERIVGRIGEVVDEAAVELRRHRERGAGRWEGGHDGAECTERLN